MINNPFGLLAFFAGMILINAVLLVPPLKSLFSIASLTGLQYAWIHIFSFGSMILIQIVKFVKSMVHPAKPERNIVPFVLSGTEWGVPP